MIVHVVYILIFFILLSLIIGIWYILNTRIVSANEQVMNTSTHIDEQVQFLANRSSEIYAPMVAVEDVENNLSVLNRYLVQQSSTFDDKIAVKTEETLQECLRGISEVNLYSRNYATKAVSNISDIDSRFLDIENQNDTWQKDQLIAYSNVVDIQKIQAKQIQNTDIKLFKETTEVQGEILNITNNLSSLSQHTTAANKIFNDRMTSYYNDLNRLQASIGRYENMTTSNIQDLNYNLQKNTYEIKRTVNDANKYLDNKINIIDQNTTNSINNAYASTNKSITQSFAMMQRNVDMYRSNINQYIDKNGNANVYIDQELQNFKTKGVFKDIELQGYQPNCRNVKGSNCEDYEYMTGFNVQGTSRCCTVPGLQTK